MNMTISEIAYDINTTKQNVNQILKRAMRKLFHKTQEIYKEWTPLEVLFGLSCLCNIKHEKDFQKFYYDFPKDIRELIINSVKCKNENEIFSSFKFA